MQPQAAQSLQMQVAALQEEVEDLRLQAFNYRKSFLITQLKASSYAEQAEYLSSNNSALFDQVKQFNSLREALEQENATIRRRLAEASALQVLCLVIGIHAEHTRSH
jgi:hypothetical protein